MRIIENLNEHWFFKKAGDPAAKDTAGWDQVHLPHCVNAFDGQDGGANYWRGKACYKKTITRPDLPQNYRFFLECEGVNSVGEVYADGKKLSEHRGGYSTFRTEITEALKKGKTDLAIIADNANYSDVYPQVADFTFYGGIYRDVSLIAVPETHFSLGYYGAPGLAFDTEIAADKKSAFVNLRAWVENPEQSDMVQFEITDDEGVVVAEAFAKAEAESHARILIEDVHLWQGRKDPYLYVVTARIIRHNETIDETEALLGVREFSVDAQKGFFLNGEPTPLRGVSRHQDMLGKGNALSAEDHWHDAHLIAELGANTVRLAHYQHSQAFYDACDILGFVVWAEIPFISVMNKDPAGHKNCREQMKELIYQNYNHPSICFWGISNEITIGGDVPGLYENLVDLNSLVKELDSTRLTTMAQVSMLPKDSKQNQITDVVSYNHYFGWYGGSMSDNEAWFDSFHAMHPDRGFGISEYGCEGIISWHSDDPKCKDYTEEYQALYHEHLARIISERGYLWATHIWNMFDFGCDARDEGGVQGRNNKGLVTLDRKIKKDSYFVYKAYWSEDAFVHIAGRRYALRTGESMSVKVYSNQDEVSLFVDGKPFGTQKGSRIFVFDNVPISEKGTTITARAKDTPKDTAVFSRVSQAHAGYVKPADPEDDEGTGAKNWFDDLDTTASAPELSFAEGFFSIKDTVGDVLANEQAARIMLDACNKFGPMKIKKSMLGIMGGMPVENFAGMISQDDKKRDTLIKLINSELQKVKKG